MTLVKSHRAGDTVGEWECLGWGAVQHKMSYTLSLVKKCLWLPQKARCEEEGEKRFVCYAHACLRCELLVSWRKGLESPGRTLRAALPPWPWVDTQMSSLVTIQALRNMGIPFLSLYSAGGD